MAQITRCRLTEVKCQISLLPVAPSLTKAPVALLLTFFSALWSKLYGDRWKNLLGSGSSSGSIVNRKLPTDESYKCVSTFCFVPASLFACRIFVCVYTATLSYGIFHLMRLPDSHCTPPAAFIWLWRVISLYKWKPVTILVPKTAWSSMCSNSFPWPQPSFQRRRLPTNSGALLFRAKESYLFSQAYLLYLEEGCSSLPEWGSCMQQERSSGFS